MYMCPPGLRPDKFNLQNRICSASDRVQDGDDDPVEGVYLLDDSGFNDIYIRKVSGDDRRLELFLEYQFGTIQEHRVPEGGIIGQPAAAGVLAVGAIPASDPGHDDPQSVSDRGPSIFIDPDDNEKTVSRNKPDVMGIDSVLITGAGGFGFALSGDRGSRFPGTSAAAPHVAGIAALVMQAQRLADPDMTKKEVADAVAQTIRDSAFDLGDLGYDGTFGYGRADAFAAVESIDDFELYSREPFTFQFTVDSTGDGADSSTTDATCDDGSGNCTLRAAIEQANALSSGVINFNISGTGTQTISPASALPTITKPVFIDGYSQSGASVGTLLIELDGAIAGTDADGLTLSGEDSVVRGLVVNGFEGNGIVLQGSSGGQFLEGNHIGTNVDGSIDDGNGSAGVYVNGAPGVLLRDNVISGNDSHGVHVSSGGASGVVLHGNTIGLNAAGAADLGNTSAGVHIDGVPDALLAMNTISGNDSHGISVSGGGASGASISGNTIGLNAAGDASVGNTGSGVHISGAEDAIVAANCISGNGSHGVALTGAGTEDTLVHVNYIGTNESGDSLGNGGSGVHIGDSSLDNSVEGNTIANNSGDGVTIVSSGSTGNTIRKNSIHTNTGRGIDLGDDGATANDTGDADTGPNSLRNYPTDITFAVRDDAASSRFKIDSTRSQRYIVDFYGCDSSSSGEGKEWLGFSEFGVGITGTTTRTVGSLRGELEEYSAATGTHVTATVTEVQTDSTSEFAPCVEMVDFPELDLSISKVEVTEDSTTETTYSIALASQPSDTVQVQIAVQFSDRSNIVNPTTGFPYTIFFTTMNWSEPVSVTVFGVTDDDAMHEANEIQHRVSIGGGNHLTAILPVFVTDDEALGTATLTSTTSGVTFPADVSFRQEYDGILELDEGDTFTYTVEMDEEPEGDVVVETFFVGGDALTVTSASITFTKTGEAADADKWEWDDPQTVTLTTLRDADDRNEFRTVRHRVEVGGEDYVVAQLSVEIRDLALSGLSFDPADLAVTVDEGGTVTYTVALASDPGDGATATVEISVESGPFDNAISVSPDDLIFTGGASGNWSTPQTVTVTGRNDDDEFDDLAEIEHILKVGSKTGLGRNVEVTVIDGNRAPYFLEGTDTTRRVSEGAGQDDEVGDPVEALDLNASDTLTYSLDDTSGKFSIDSGTGQIKVAADGALDYETATLHEFNVIAKDAGGLSDKIDVTVLVRNVDEPLEVTGDTSPTFNENSNISNRVSRYTARDPEGSPVTFTRSVEGADGSDFAIDSSGNLKFSSQPDHETQDEYSIVIVATDTADSFNSGELPVTVTVTDVNEPPEITGDGSVDYQENQTGSVATFGFVDREGDDVAWSLSGTDRGDFTITETISGDGELRFAGTPNFESPADSGSNNDYNLTIVATDDGTPVQVGRLDVNVTVEDVNEPPSTPTGNASITVAENASGNLSRYSSSDPERRTIQWSVTGTDGAAFRIDSSGNLAFDGAPDYETPEDSGGNNSYDIAVTATDDGNLADGTASSVGRLSSSFNVAVTVTQVNEPPEIIGPSSVSNYFENETRSVGSYSAADPEGDTPITWGLGGPDRGDFDISNSGVLTFKSAPDSESPADSGGDNHYEVVVQATDSNNNRSERHVDVTVRNVDEPPTLEGPDTFDNFPENSATTRQVGRYTANDPEGTTVVLSLQGPDNSAFSLNSNGVLTFNESPDYEDQSSYSATVRAVAGIHTMDRVATVNIQNLEEPGEITLSSVQPQADTAFTATLEDDDEPSGVTWQWYLASSRSSTGTTISGETSDSYTPTSGDVGSYLRVAASYDDGFDMDNWVAGVSRFRVRVETPGNVAPEFASGGDYDRSIRENTRGGSNVGAPVTASDDNDDGLTYLIDDSDFFEIDDFTGQLRNRVVLDHEVQATYTVTVDAVDPSGLSDSVDVTITVEDVDEAPEISGPSAVDRDEGGGTEAATFTATDPDEKGIGWALSGTDSEDFDLSGGVLAFKGVPDFEEPEDSNGDNRYQVTIEVEEQGDGTSSATLNVAVKVSNADEEGTLSAVSTAERVGYEIELEIEDPDGVSSVREWNWERSENQSYWSAIQEAHSSSYTPSIDDKDRYLRATAFYRDMQGPGKSAEYVSNQIREIFSVPETLLAPTVSAGVRSLSVSWSRPQAHPAVSGYVVRHRESGSTDPWTENEVTGNVLRYTLGGLTVGTGYEVEVQAENALGTSGWSTSTEGTPSAGGGGGGSGGGPSPVVTDDECSDDLGALSGTATRSGTWGDDCESSVSGRRYARYYGFTLSAGAEVTIDLTSSVDTYLFLRSGSATSGAALHSNDDIVGGNTNSRIVATLSAGSYTIEATTYSPNTTGSFTLSVSGGIGGGDGSGGDTVTGCNAASLTLPTSGVSGSWGDDCESSVPGRGYARYYGFTLSAGAEVTIDLTSSVDTYLFLRSGSSTSGTALHSNDDIVSGNTNSRIVATLSAGSYTIEATTYSPSTAGSFTLSVSGGSGGGDGGGGDTPTGCNAASLTLPASGVSGTWGDDCESSVPGRGYARYYSFTLSAEAEAEATIDLTSSVDTYLFLRSGSSTSGTALHSNDDIVGGNTNSRIVATLSAGSYTIEATTYSPNTTGSFTLSVSGGSGGGDGSGGETATGCNAASLTLPASGVSGSWGDDCESSVSSRGYARYYGFTLSAEAEVTIDLTSSVDTYLFLRSGSSTSGTALHSNDDIVGGNTNSRIVATLSAGSYTIEATTYSPNTAGSFTLSVSGGGSGGGDGSGGETATGCNAASLTLPASGVSGTWGDDCESSVPGRGYARYYSFTLSAEAEVTIDLTSSVDTYLFLRSGSATSGTALHSNDDIVGGNTNSRIVATLSAGSYTIEATTYSPSTTSSFTLSVGGGESTGGGETATGCNAASLTLPASGVSGTWGDDCESSVSSRGYARYYSFTLSAEAEAEATIDLTSSVDTYLFLRSGSSTSGTALHSNDDIVSGNTNSRIVAALSAGSYTIEATTYSPNTSGSFTLSVSGGGG